MTLTGPQPTFFLSGQAMPVCGCVLGSRLLGERRGTLSSHDNTFWSKVGPVTNQEIQVT